MRLRTSPTRWVLTAILAVTVLGGCNAPFNETPDDPTPDTIDASTWAPSQPISHPTYTEAEQLEWREGWLISMAQESGMVDPPEVDLIRWTTSMREYQESYAECSTNAGFPQTLDTLGLPYFDPPPPASQKEALDLVLYTCNAQYSPLPQLMDDWSPDQLGLLWDYWNEAFLPCLEAQGVELPDGPVPSRETYVETFYSDPDSRWWPYEALFSLPEDRLDPVAAMCPPYPPDEHFYGS